MKIRIAIIFPTDAPSENILSYCIVTITAQRFLLRADKVFTRSNDEFQSLHILMHVCMTEGKKNK